MDQPQVLVGVLEPVDGRLAGVGAAVVDDPEDPARRGVGLALITCSTSRANGSIPVFSSTRPKRLAWWTSQAASRRGCRGGGTRTRPAMAGPSDRDGRVTAAERLQLGLFIGGGHVLLGTQPITLETALVEVEHPAGLRGEARVAGKDQERSCHGLMAAREPAPDRRRRGPGAPRSITSRCSSVRLKRESGSPWTTGNSHAIALTSATCSGGKTARAARALSILESGQPLLEEPLPPTTNDLRRRLQPPRDLRVALTVGRVQDHLRPHHHLVRQRVTGDATLQLGTLLAAQHDYEPARPRHADTIRCREHCPFTDY